MSAFKKIKCYLSCALVAWLVYAVSTTCPIGNPLPYGNDSMMCKYSHDLANWATPYTSPVVNLYNASPVKPYVDQSIEVSTPYVKKTIDIVSPYVGKSIEVVSPYVSNAKNIVTPHFSQLSAWLMEKAKHDPVCPWIHNKMDALLGRLNDDSLSNELKENFVEKIVIPAEENLQAFIGTPKDEEKGKVDPVVPEETVKDEPTPVPSDDAESNTVIDTQDSEIGKVDAIKSAVAEPVEEIGSAIPETSDLIEAATNIADITSSSQTPMINNIINEVEDIVENLAVEQAIEAAEALGEHL